MQVGPSAVTGIPQRPLSNERQTPFSVLGPQRHSPKKTSFMSCPMFAFSRKTLLKGTQEMGVLECLPTCLCRGGDWKRPGWPRGRTAQRRASDLCISPKQCSSGWPSLAASALQKCAFYLCFPFSGNTKGKRGAQGTGVPNQLVRPSQTMTGLWRPFGPSFYFRYKEAEALSGNVIC